MALARLRAAIADPFLTKKAYLFKPSRERNIGLCAIWFHPDEPKQANHL